MMKRIFALMQVFAMIWLVALAFPQLVFPQTDGSNETPRDPIPDTPSSTTQATSTNCPCVATAEYNPVCGTDNVTYWNRGRFNCAKNCNPALEIRLIRACEPYSTLSSN